MTICSCIEEEGQVATVEARHICPERALAHLMEMEKSKTHPDQCICAPLERVLQEQEAKPARQVLMGLQN
jgi:hypothetical protein